MLVLAHKNLRLVKKAIEALSSEDSGFFVHIDRKSDVGSLSKLPGPEMSLSWGIGSPFTGENSPAGKPNSC